ncbi:MAG: hypothetical protein LBH74_00975 [Nitrososphaerota archaeon]|nr:hypothetical protein [Nitrososphaerota archaeon]
MNNKNRVYNYKKVAIVLAFILGVGVVMGVLVLGQINDKKTITWDSDFSKDTVREVSDGVKIEAFNWIGWGVPGGVTAAVGFNVTAHNLGTKIEDMIINITVIDASDSVLTTETFIERPPYYDDGFNGTIRTGETRIIRGFVITSLNTVIGAPSLGNITAVIQASANGTVLDEFICESNDFGSNSMTSG